MVVGVLLREESAVFGTINNGKASSGCRGCSIRVVICRYDGPDEALTDASTTPSPTARGRPGSELQGSKEPIVDAGGTQIGEGAGMTNPDVQELEDNEIITSSNNEISILIATKNRPRRAGPKRSSTT